MLSSPLTFIVGTGRCGSTVFHDLLATHPDVAWLSSLCDRHPDAAWWNRALMRALDLPGMSLLRRHFYPAEVYRFWDHHSPGFSAPCRDLTADDAMPRQKRRLRRALSGLTTPGRPHVLAKITGWPRIGFLHEVFPHARFIHVYRDGRATAASLLDVDFWRGWKGPGEWRWGPLSLEQEEKWHRHGRSFVALAGIQWEILMDAQEEARRHLPADRLLEVRYEDLCSDPAGALRRATDFLGLDFPPAFVRDVARFDLANQNGKWRDALTLAQQETLEECLHDALKRWGYPSAATQALGVA